MNPAQEQHGDRTAPTFAHTAFDVVAIAASAGGLRAVREVLAGLPTEFPAALLVVQHLDRKHRSYLAEILGRSTRLPVQEARDRDRLGPGIVYVAPPNLHLRVTLDGELALSLSDLVNYLRPSADVLFESVALAYRSRAIAVVLSGTGHDGSAGVRTIKDLGGTVIAQEPSTAEFPGMPDAAIASRLVDHIVPLDQIPPTLVHLVMRGFTE